MPLRKCPYCKGLSNFHCGDLRAGTHFSGKVSLDICQNCQTPVYFRVQDENNRDKILDSYPKIDTELDEELPGDIKKPFKEAMESLNSGNWNSCVTMCRRAIQEAMEDLGAKGDDLYHQIDSLEAERKIATSLKEWAHEGRLSGNLGAHGVKSKKWADKNDAEETFEFCKWFFRYVYVLPKQLAQRKERLAQEATKTST